MQNNATYFFNPCLYKTNENKEETSELITNENI